MDDLIKDFLAESNENLARLEHELVVLEKDPTSQETLASIFRTVHTIKGTCGFLALAKLESVAHAGENLLGRLRGGQLRVTPEITTALLSMVDAIQQMLRSIEAAGNEGAGDYTELVRVLERLAGAGPAGSVPPPHGVPVPVPVPVPAPTQSTPTEPMTVETSESHAKDVAEGTIRVHIDILDRLMNLVGELVLARNQVLQLAALRQDSSFLAMTQRVNRVTAELQDAVMKTRMQPIGTIWSRFPRMVRDLALALGKRVKLDREGSETELDKTILEAIKDPLTHLVRNAVDHGIESPEARIARSKPAEGHLLLRAFHEGGQVSIELTDDGAGIDLERVKRKALDSGLVTSDRLARLSDREVVNLIFLPGLTTAEHVTNLSGRGVGMDVVQTNIEKIGGTVDVQSRPGAGTTVKIKIPLTLAIIPVLTVSSGDERYAIPQANLMELVCLRGERAEKGVEWIHGCPVLRLRGSLLPLVYLGSVLAGGTPPVRPAGGGGEDAAVHIVVLQAENHPFGLVVDRINEAEEIVVKPLGKLLKGIPIFAGATIMGDGSVLLILDALGVAQASGVLSEVQSRGLREKPAAPAARSEDRQTLLLCRVEDDGRIAIPLTRIARLEEVPGSRSERVGGQEVVQYRGEILPLIRVATVLRERRAQPRHGEAEPEPAQRGTLQVVVCSDQGKSAGLVVDRILDIVEENLLAKRPATRPGVLFSVVIRDRVTEYLDVAGAIRAANPSVAEPPQVNA